MRENSRMGDGKLEKGEEIRRDERVFFFYVFHSLNKFLIKEFQIKLKKL